MQWIGLVGVLATMMLAAAVDTPPPVILDLGPVLPTPAPTPEASVKKRLITTITVQNAPDGDSVINFEASDFAEVGEERFDLIAVQRYPVVVGEKPELQEQATRILLQIRELEREMLAFAEAAGPPKPPAPVGTGDHGARPER
jgi:hypothetical protein